MNPNIKALLAELTLQEKASLCSGFNFWETQAVERLEIPSIMMCDGPHGLRKQVGRGEGENVDTVPATCFPPASGLASSWNVELMEKVGQAIGQECRAEDVSIVLGPGVNIKRSPVCGRNFEYFSEDPLLSGALGEAWVKGVQSQGVGTSLKHFAANNQETERMSIDVQIDEQTLHEIYLPAFERIVKNANPWTLMCAYNKLNGELCSENKHLLTDILRKQWGYEGYMISDWGAVDQRVNALKAGLDLQMPEVGGVTDQEIVDAVQAGELEEATLDQTVERHLNLLIKATATTKPEVVLDQGANHRLAQEAASESMVLLKNEDDVLPLKTKSLSNIAVLGEFAMKPRIQGGGSSRVLPTQEEIPLDALKQVVGDAANIHYAPGYSLENDSTDSALLEEAKGLAKTAEVALVFVGLPESYESEGYDRDHMELPPSHTQLLESICEVQKNVVVVLTQGSATTMKAWHGQVKGILLGWLLGQGGGSAMANVLWGNTNPSGKLAETLPYQLSDNPSFLNFPGKKQAVSYQEGLFVGYRYYDTKQMEVQYPFGHGLSYTSFDYSDLELSHKSALDSDTVQVRCTIKNTGSVAGKETVQLYVRDVESSDIRPEKELKAFSKVKLAPGEEKDVVFYLDQRDFAFYDTDAHGWQVESGYFEILVGRSSRDLPLQQRLHVQSSETQAYSFNRHSTMEEVMKHGQQPELTQQLVDQFRVALLGAAPTDGENEHLSEAMVEAIIRYLPLRSIYHWTKGEFTPAMLETMLANLNSHD